MENTRNKGHWYKRDRKKGRGGSFGGRGDGYEDMVASGDDDIDHRRPQELQISSIIDKSKRL